LLRDSEMAFEVSYNLENEQQFWDGESASATPTMCARQRLICNTEIDDIVSTRCQEHDIIDNCLRSFLNVTTNYKCTRQRETAWMGVNDEQPSTSRPTTAS